MKKILIFIMVVMTTYLSLGFDNSINVYCQETITVPSNTDKANIEGDYIKQLQSISNQLDILSSNALDTITNKKSSSELLKDASFIKTQIRNLRSELGEYHKTESGNIEKNPLSLSLLNTLNYYSMSLSYMQGFLESNSTSDASRYLERYYASKASGDQLLLWDKEQLND